MIRRILTFLVVSAGTAFAMLYSLYDGDLHQIVEPVVVRMEVAPDPQLDGLPP